MTIYNLSLIINFLYSWHKVSVWCTEISGVYWMMFIMAWSYYDRWQNKKMTIVWIYCKDAVTGKILISQGEVFISVSFCKDNNSYHRVSACRIPGTCIISCNHQIMIQKKKNKRGKGRLNNLRLYNQQVMNTRLAPQDSISWLHAFTYMK